MFPSQASCTFNPFLPFNVSISIQHIPSGAITSFVRSPILQSVADFISPSHSSCTTLPKPTLTFASTSTDDLTAKERTTAHISFDFLEAAVSTVLGDYLRLTTAAEAMNMTEAQERFDFSQKALLVAENNQFKCHAINFLCRLATLVLEYPQQSLLKNAHILYQAFSSSTGLSNSLKQHKSFKVYELLGMFFNMPLTCENLVYREYVKNCKEKRDAKVEEQEKPVKPQSVKLYNEKGVVCSTSNNLMDMLMVKKIAVCSEEDLEEESERHERSSTTSASSRTIAGEVELPLTYNCFNSFPQTNKTTPAPKEKDSYMHEIYDGCSFGDLTIDFKATDKLLLQYDEPSEKGKADYNKPANKRYFHKIPSFNTNQNAHSNFNPRPEESTWKVNPFPVFDPNLLKTSPPVVDQKVIPLNLFTLPKGTLMPTAPFNVFNPLNLVLSGPGQVQQMPRPPFNNMMAPMNPITPVIPQVVQPQKPVVAQKPRGNVKGVQVKDGKRQQKGQNTVPMANKGLDSVSAPKNSQGQVNNSGSAVKKPNSQKSKKKQDKAGLKLWDMINAQGKLKQ